MPKGGGEAQADADECLECGTCLADLRSVTGPIRQCQRGHLQCAHCFALLGGPEALCPTCEIPLGDIRNRLAEALRDMSVLRNAVGASGGGTGGSVNTGKRKTTETDKGLLSLLRATGLEQEAGHLAEHGFSCREDVLAMREEDLPRLGMRFRPLLEGVESLRTQAVADACKHIAQQPETASARLRLLPVRDLRRQAVADAYSARLRLLREVETLWTECYLPKGTGKWRQHGVPSDIMDAWRRMQKDTGIVPAMRDCLLKPMNDMGVQEWRTRVAEIGKCQKCTASWSRIATSIREFCEGKCPHIVSNSVKAPAPARETVTSQRQTATKKSAAAPALQLEALTAPTPPPPPAPASQVQNTEHEAIRSGVAMALAAYYCSIKQ